MRRSKLSALARSITLIASVGAPSLALAADLLPPLPEPPPPPIVDFGGGWYLRGDVGASVYDRPKLSRPGDSVESIFYGSDLGGGAFAGVGVGYQFNEFLRADVTGEYRFSSGFKGNDVSTYTCAYASDCPGFDIRTKTNEVTTGNYSSAVVLANGYVDLGTFYGVTPFVGGGVGVAFNRFSGFSDSSDIKSDVYDQFGNYASFGSSSGGAYKDKNKTSFAWALHAGLGYSVTQNLKLEFAYRYLNLGQGSTGVLNCYGGGVCLPLKFKELASHDVKIGFRYFLEGAAIAALPPLAPDYVPGPLVRKY